jgi:hypothetical protein
MKYVISNNKILNFFAEFSNFEAENPSPLAPVALSISRLISAMDICFDLWGFHFCSKMVLSETHTYINFEHQFQGCQMAYFHKQKCQFWYILEGNFWCILTF